MRARAVRGPPVRPSSLCPARFVPRDRKQREGSQGDTKRGLRLWITSTRGKKKRSRLTRKTPPRPRDHPQCGCCYQHPEFRHEETEAQKRHVASPKIASKDNSLKGGHARRSTQVLESVPSSEQFFSAKATRVNKNGEKGPCRWALGKQCCVAETVLGCRGVQPGDPRLPRTLDCRRFPGTHRTPGLFTSTPTTPFQES